MQNNPPSVMLSDFANDLANHLNQQEVEGWRYAARQVNKEAKLSQSVIDVYDNEGNLVGQL